MTITPRILIPAALLAILAVAAPRAAAEEDWQTLHEQARAALAAGERETAWLRLDEAMTGAEAAGAPLHHFEATMIDVARAQQRGGRFDEAKVLYRRAYAVRETRVGAGHPTLAELLGELALVCAAQRDFAEAEEVTRRALVIQERALGANHLDVGVTLYRLGTYAIEQGRCEDAEAHFRRSLKITNRAFASGTSLAGTMTTFAHMQRARRRLEVAEKLYRRALELHRHSVPDRDPAVQRLLSRLGILYEEGARWTEAADVYRTAFRARPTDHFAARLWWATARRGQRVEADRVLTRHTAVRRTTSADDWPGKLLFFLLGHLEAEALLQAAERTSEAAQPARRCEAHFYIGARHLLANETDRAVEHFRASGDTGAREAPEYECARAELARLDPTDEVMIVEEMPIIPDW